MGTVKLIKRKEVEEREKIAKEQSELNPEGATEKKLSLKEQLLGDLGRLKERQAEENREFLSGMNLK